MLALRATGTGCQQVVLIGCVRLVFQIHEFTTVFSPCSMHHFWQAMDYDVEKTANRKTAQGNGYIKRDGIRLEKIKDIHRPGQEVK